MLFKFNHCWALLLGLASGGMGAAVAQVAEAPLAAPVPIETGAPAVAPPLPAPDPLRFSKVTPLGMSPDWSEMQDFQQRLTRDEFEKAWSEIYSPENGLPPPFQITPEALVVPTGMLGIPEVKIAFRTDAKTEATAPKTYWRRAHDLPPLRGRPPLSDLHIALDPGHIGGQWARMEERFLSFQPGEAIQEGDLSLATALALKERLLALGAVVSLVRENHDPVTEQRPTDFQTVALKTLREAGIPQPLPDYSNVTGDAKILTVQWQTEKLFYRVSEIHARAQKVNLKLKPDIVLCLHLNAEGWGPSDAPQYTPQNHLHVLVNGCYAPVELENADTRHEMLKRLFQRVHEEEIPLATAIAEAMARTTRLPAYLYTTPNARKVGTNPYVYARNLLANRLYQCPVVYLEPFVMNHEPTYRRLLAGHYVGRTLIAGRLQPSALEEYVQGVLQGLVAYYQNQRPS